VNPGDDLFTILRAALKPEDVPEKSVIAITSKIVSLCQNRVVPIGSIDKKKLIESQAELFTDPHSSKYNMTLTITNGQLAVSAGIDESNANGMYVLWPENIQESANEIWQMLRDHLGRKELGVIITDSRTQPLYWGVIGASLAHCGFQALNRLIGRPDIFGREMHMTQESVYQALAVAAVFEMGEGAQQTPIAVVNDIREIAFQDRPPTEEELSFLRIEPEDDVYAPILLSAPWKTGGRGE